MSVEKELLKMPRGLKLFYADYIDDDDRYQYNDYVVGRTYDSAFNRWYKHACDCCYRFSYYFYEVEDEEGIDKFIRRYGKENIKAGVY